MSSSCAKAHHHQQIHLSSCGKKIGSIFPNYYDNLDSQYRIWLTTQHETCCSSFMIPESADNSLQSISSEHLQRAIQTHF